MKEILKKEWMKYQELQRNIILMTIFIHSMQKKVTSDSKTTTTINEILDFLAGYILESENLTTKKNEYNILDEKRMKDVEMNEQGLPSYSSDDEETTAEFELTSALINKERLLKYEDTVYQLLKGDYELINDGAAFEDLWCYQTLPNEDTRGLVEGIYNTIQYYLSEMHTTRSKKQIMINRRIKELLYGDIGSIVRSYTKFETVQKELVKEQVKNMLLNLMKILQQIDINKFLNGF